MKYSKILWVSLATLVMGSTAAMAQEAVDWTGFYAGVYGGYSSGDADITLSPAAGAPFAPIAAGGDLNGLFGGVTGGFNYQLQQGFVVGAEADIGVADMSGIASFDLGGGGTVLPLTSEVSSVASVRARAGFAVDRFLPFVTAGVAVGSIRQSINGAGGGGAGSIDLADETIVGWTVGAGLEYAVTDAISVKAEYRYSQYDGDDTSSAIFPSTTSASSFSTHDVRLGLNYRF